MVSHDELHEELGHLLDRVYLDAFDWPKAELEEEIEHLRQRLAPRAERGT
jgi:hypothetical protein